MSQRVYPKAPVVVAERELRRIEPCQLGLMFDDVIDRLWVQRSPRNIAPAIDGPEYTALVDLGCVEPGVEGLYRAAGEIHHLVVLYAIGLGAPRWIEREGRGGPLSTSMASSGCNCSSLRPAISLRRRSPEAEATIRMAPSLTAPRLPVAQVARSFASTSPVTAFALLRFLGRGIARIESLMDDRRAGEAKKPWSPRHFVSVDLVMKQVRRAPDLMGSQASRPGLGIGGGRRL